MLKRYLLKFIFRPFIPIVIDADDIELFMCLAEGDPSANRGHAPKE